MARPRGQDGEVDLRERSGAPSGAPRGVEHGLQILGLHGAAYDLWVDRADRQIFAVAASNSLADRYVVKVDANLDRHHNEVTGNEFARRQLVPTAPIVLASAGSAQQPGVIVFRRSNGRPLTTSVDAADWAAAGSALSTLHSATPECSGHSGRWSDHLLTQAVDHLDALGTRVAELADERPRLWRVLQHCFAGLDLDALAPLHGDCTPDHVFLEPGAQAVAAIVDFSEFGCGDPALELATLTMHHPAPLDDVLVGYRPNEALRGRLSATVPGYRILRHLGLARREFTEQRDGTAQVAAAIAIAADGHT